MAQALEGNFDDHHAQMARAILGRLDLVEQSLVEQARRTAREMADRRRRERAEREMADRRRRERAERERRVVDLAEQVMVAIGQRDAAVAEAEKRAGEALRELIEVEGMALGEAIARCGETVGVREATRLRRLAAVDQDASASATTASAENGGAGVGTSVG